MVNVRATQHGRLRLDPEKEMVKKLTNQIPEIRKAERLTYAEAAELVGYSTDTYTKVEKGIIRLDLPRLLRLLANLGYGCSVELLKRD